MCVLPNICPSRAVMLGLGVVGGDYVKGTSNLIIEGPGQEVWRTPRGTGGRGRCPEEARQRTKGIRVRDPGWMSWKFQMPTSSSDLLAPGDGLRLRGLRRRRGPLQWLVGKSDQQVRPPVCPCQATRIATLHIFMGGGSKTWEKERGEPGPEFEHSLIWH